MPGYVSPQQLANLRQYKYSGIDKSITSKYILNPFWTWLVTLWPKVIAPNTITLTGLSLVVINFFTLLYYDSKYLTEKEGYHNPPNWVYYTWGICLFLYQSLDAIDGKQARRTGMAGPLGEMFDHGCDAMNTTLGAILAGRALNLGRSWWTVSSLSFALMNFYLTTWEEWHTGTLYLGVFSGPVEGILMVVAIFLVTGKYGPELWATPFLSLPVISNIVSWIPVKLPQSAHTLGTNELFMVLAALGLLFNIVTSYTNVLRTLKANSSSLAPLLGLIPFFITLFLHITWLYAPVGPNGAHLVYSDALIFFMVFWGLQFANQVGRMILAHVTKSSFPFWEWMWIWSTIGTVDANSQFLFGRPPTIQNTPQRTLLFVFASLFLALARYARFCTLVINDITDYLGIACFTVRKKDAKGNWKSAEDVDSSKPKANGNGIGNGHGMNGNAKKD
jgi:ethanolaminephosphotransferase